MDEAVAKRFDSQDAAVTKRFDSQDEVLAALDQKVTRMLNNFEDHVLSDQAHQQQVLPVVEAMDSMRAGIKVIGWLGGRVTRLAAIIGAIATGLVAWKQWRP